MNEHTVITLTTLGSAAFGWFLNEASQFLRSRSGDKKIRKRVLFHLLETYHILGQLDTKDDADLLVDRIILKLPKETQTDEFRDSLKSYCNQIIINLFREHAFIRFAELEEGYNKAIDDLSSVDPIMAYYLKGQTKIKMAFDIFENYKDKVAENFNSSRLDLTQTHNFLEDDLKPEIIKHIVDELKKNILQISKSINYFSIFRTKKIINSNSYELSNEKIGQIEQLLENIIKQMMAS